MRVLKNPPSASDSVKAERSAGAETDAGTRFENTRPFQAADGKTAAVPAVSNDHAPAIEPAQEPSAPAAGEDAGESSERRPRSLRLRWRFWRSLAYFGLLFVRVVFWQVYAYRYFPERARRGEIARWRKYARGYRRFAVSLGGVYIKLGQFISTRVDLFPEEVVKELESLQDEVPTIHFNKIRAVIEAELGGLEGRFQQIAETPVAAASLGQVHRARLLNGDKVVVKVQRPGIRDVCRTDLAAMRVVARVAMKWQFIANRADACGLVEEFGKVLLEELSYRHEAGNAARFQEMFKDDLGVYIPSVYGEHSTDQVLTMEDVTSIKINDYAAIEAAGISRKAVANRLMDTYLHQVFNHYFFHADPHPGNLFVYPLPVESQNGHIGAGGRPFYLVFVDFGMTGTLTRAIADGMVSTLSAVLTRDHRRLVHSYQELGFLLPDADIPRIEEATRAAFDQVWGLTMAEMRDIDYERVVDLAAEFNDLIFSMPFYIPQDFIYLGRTISILSGICTGLDPAYNPWHELEPYVEGLVARGFGIDTAPGIRGSSLSGMAMFQTLLTGGGVQALRAVSEELVRRALGPISRSDEVLQQLLRGELRVTAELSQSHRQQLKRLERESRRTARAVFFGSVLIASTLLYTAGDVTLAAAGYAVCGLTLLFGFLRD